MDDSPPTRFTLFWLRVRWSAETTAELARTYTVTFIFVLALSGAAGTYFSSQSESEPSMTTSLLLGLLAAGLPVLAVFAWAYLTAPRRSLQGQVYELQAQVERLHREMLALAQQVMGDPNSLTPLYHDLRIDLKEARQLIEEAQASGMFWPYSVVLDDKAWKRGKEQLAKHPWAQADELYGVVAEAFGQVERVRKLVAPRFFNRSVKPSDRLDLAIGVIRLAEDRLTEAIGEGEQLPFDEGSGDQL